MVGSIGDRMLDITLPHVAAWNMWWSQYGNSVDGFARVKERVDGLIAAAGRAPGDVEATAAVYFRLPGGVRRQMGDYDTDVPTEPHRGLDRSSSPTTSAASPRRGAPTSRSSSTRSPATRSPRSATC